MDIQKIKKIETVQDMVQERAKWQDRGLKVALVPTMGYFHEGHLALMRRARELADRVVVSLFVNPAQFGPSEDLDRYPRDLEKDMALAEKVGVDCIFTPEPREMYPNGYQTWIDVIEITSGLCGRSRPGHFRGVATVVAKLFNIIRPHLAIFGKKDFQQLKVIEQMVRDLNFQVDIIGHEIVREPDGLAMSSRNTYLSAQERKTALILYESLELAQKLVASGTTAASDIIAEIKRHIVSHPKTRIDYIFLGDPDTLSECSVVGKETLLALAVWVGNTRLIDNTILYREIS